MTRTFLAGAAAIAAAAIIPQWPAVAQNSGAPVIVVAAPTTARPAGSPVDGVQQRKQLVANVLVFTGDLNLRTASGRSALDQRVRVAADTACDRLDRIEPPSGLGSAPAPDSGDCRFLARKNAQPGVRAAIIQAYG